MKKIMVEFDDSIFMISKYRFGSENKKVATDSGKSDYSVAMVKRTTKHLRCCQPTCTCECLSVPILYATHSSSLAWRIPWTEEPGGLESMGPQSNTSEVT